MFSPELKKEISEKVQAILQETSHAELPDGEVQFLLHVDGSEFWSWANIHNNSAKDNHVPDSLVKNISVQK